MGFQNAVKLGTLVIMTAAILSPGVNAFAGNDGHGGGALICSKTRDNELLDLWEAEVPGLYRYEGLHIKRSNIDAEDQIAAALFRLALANPEFGRKVESVYRFISVHWVGLDKDDPSLPPISDAFSNFFKPDCVLKSVANYVDETDTLNLDLRYLGILKKTDVAALWVHEAVYKVLRQTKKVDNSIGARRIVGLLFSKLPVAKIAGEIDSIVRGSAAENSCSNLVQTAPGQFLVRPGFSGESYVYKLNLVESPTNQVGCRSARWRITVFNGNHRDYLETTSRNGITLNLGGEPDSTTRIIVGCKKILPVDGSTAYMPTADCSKNSFCDFNVVLTGSFGEVVTLGSFSGKDYEKGKILNFYRP